MPLGVDFCLRGILLRLWLWRHHNLKLERRVWVVLGFAAQRLDDLLTPRAPEQIVPRQLLFQLNLSYAPNRSHEKRG